MACLPVPFKLVSHTVLSLELLLSVIISRVRKRIARSVIGSVLGPLMVLLSIFPCILAMTFTMVSWVINPVGYNMVTWHTKLP